MVFKTKRGQGLPLNTVILAILVIVVLVIIIAFFLSGTSTTIQKAKEIFGFGLRGTDLSTARLSCEQYCEQAQALPEEQQPDSAYCNTWFKLDLDPNDGSVDKNPDNQPYQYYCGSQALESKSADEAASAQLINGRRTVGIGCNVQCVGRAA